MSHWNVRPIARTHRLRFGLTYLGPALLLFSCFIVSSCSAGSARSTDMKADGKPDMALETGLKTEQDADNSEPSRAGAFGGSLDGRFIYEKACASCHANGFNGAPRLMASDWPAYKELGVDHYTYNAIQGIGIMPARGGQPLLLDAQVRRAVEYMLEQLDKP